MQTVELLQEARWVAERLGYQIREENLGGVGGGACEFGGRKWLFVDLAQTAPEQLEAVTATLRDDPSTSALQSQLSPQLAWHLGLRRAAA
ncbi:MAG TPA: hypothetical protein ENJ16_04320 [Planctomycetaceae bacterium]|nr:hypothetical protein [Planctomycetaceae bacterium]